MPNGLPPSPTVSENHNSRIPTRLVIFLVVIFLTLWILFWFNVFGIYKFFQSPSFLRISPTPTPFSPQTVQSVKQVGSQARLPAQFPVDFPKYPDVKLESVTESETGFTVLFVAEDGVNKVRSFYEEELEKEGWQFQLSQQAQQTKSAFHYSLNKGNIIGGLTLVQKDIYQVTAQGTPSTQISNFTTTITINFGKGSR